MQMVSKKYKCIEKQKRMIEYITKDLKFYSYDSDELDKE